MSSPNEIMGTPSFRKLHFFWLVDWSHSMDGQKIQMVNYAIREVIPEIRRIEENERIKIVMSAIRFGDKADWYVGPDPVSVHDFEWQDIKAVGGLTATAQAVELLVDALRIEKIGGRNVPPVCILLSDGYCTDEAGRYEEAISKLDDEPWGKKAVRLSIGIGKTEGDFNKEELDAFISPYLRKESRLETLHADRPLKIIEFIRLASVVATVAASRTKENTAINANQPPPVHIEMGMLSPDSGLPDFTKLKAEDVF